MRGQRTGSGYRDSERGKEEHIILFVACITGAGGADLLGEQRGRAREGQICQFKCNIADTVFVVFISERKIPSDTLLPQLLSTPQPRCLCRNGA